MCSLLSIIQHEAEQNENEKKVHAAFGFQHQILYFRSNRQ